MNLWTLLIAIAVVAAIVALWRGKPIFGGAALVASGLELLMAHGIVHLHVKGTSLTLVLGGVIAVAGALLYAKSSEKLAVTAATILTMVGAIQVLSVLHLF